MLDLTIDRLQLHITSPPGQEQRIRLITQRAMALLAEQLSEWKGDTRSTDGQQIESVRVAPAQLDFARLSDEQAAQRLADALAETVLLKLQQ